MFFALMALAAAALAVAATRSHPAAEAGPDESPVVHFSWSVRAMPKQPAVDARAVSADVPAVAAESVVRGASLPMRMVGLARARRAHISPRVPRVFCPRPRTLRLTRYEDGSAVLICAGSVLARVSVPG